MVTWQDSKWQREWIGCDKYVLLFPYALAHIPFIAFASVFKHKRAHYVRVYIMDIFSVQTFFLINESYHFSLFPYIINYRVIRYLLEPPLHNKHLMTGPEGNT